jgi:hypothetical protein
VVVASRITVLSKKTGTAGKIYLEAPVYQGLSFKLENKWLNQEKRIVKEKKKRKSSANETKKLKKKKNEKPTT